jgi:naphthalene 1,2-dioxygenase system ferredoxin subunit
MKHTVAVMASIPAESMIHVDVAGVALAIYHVGGNFYATDDICTHRRARLSDGYLDGTVVQCPLHFGKFDIVTGQPLNPPCKIPVQTYPVTLDGDQVIVDVPAAA